MIVLPFGSPDEMAAALGPALRHLRDGGIFGYPTETVYGVGCTLGDGGLERMVAIKRGESRKPFLLLVTGAGMLPALQWTPAARALAAAFWPGPLTLVLASQTHALPDAVTGENGAVAVRATSHAGMRALIAALGAPITSSSANAPGAPPALDAPGAVRALRALGAPKKSLVLDGGAIPASESSTLLDCTGAVPRLLRAGAIGVARIAEVVEVRHE